ncbi:unnamed protein product [Rotaria magnacalcarata]|uniref:Reverse transcriptase domain-containing protein n=1 Tax=Rotaria magnacalcarata TaxID=392030 RepID=A0A820C7R2_9BILA|nr:unnamed protein product [Rotaria magnacalcarata]
MEQFAEHDNNQSDIEVEANVVDHELVTELQMVMAEAKTTELSSLYRRLVKKLPDWSKGVHQGSCVGPVWFIVFHYDLLNSVSNLHFKPLFADDLAVVLSPSVTWSSKVLIPYLSQQITNTFWTLFHRQISPTIPTTHCENNTIAQVPKFKYLELKIQKNSTVFKRLSSTRMLSTEISHKLYYTDIHPYYQSILDIHPILSSSKKQQLDALNRKFFRIINRWYDAANDE